MWMFTRNIKVQNTQRVCSFRSYNLNILFQVSTVKKAAAIDLKVVYVTTFSEWNNFPKHPLKDTRRTESPVTKKSEEEEEEEEEEEIESVWSWSRRKGERNEEKVG